MFIANKLFLKAGKTKYLFFHKKSAHDSIPMRLPTLTFNSIELKRESFFGVIIDENNTWNKHIELAGIKHKNIGMLYRALRYLDKKVKKTYIFLLFVTM